jgi:uncharacterized membrane protein
VTLPAGVEARYIATAGTLIELAAAIVVTWHAVDALVGIVRGLGSDRARRVIAEGVLAALSFSVAGTLLKTIALNSWVDIRTFAFVLVLRTVLKRVFQAEQRALLRRT